MKNFKLANDFGVTALFGTLIIIGSFLLLSLGVIKELVNFKDLLTVLASWVSGIVTGYIVIKGQKPK